MERWKGSRRSRGLNWGLENEGVRIRAREEEGRSHERVECRPKAAAGSGVGLGSRECAGMGDNGCVWGCSRQVWT